MEGPYNCIWELTIDSREAKLGVGNSQFNQRLCLEFKINMNSTQKSLLEILY